MASTTLCPCSQWIACHTKVKQHYRLSRPTDFDLFAEDARRACCKFNTPASPCEHCGVTVKAYRQHPRQVSSHGSTEGDVRAARRGAVGSNGLGASQEGSRRGDGPCQQKQSPRTEQGKGSPGSQAPSNKPPWRRARGKGPLPLLYAAAQKWKKAQEENATTTTLRTALFGCLIQMLHTGLKDIGSEGSAPFQKKAEELNWLKEGLWSYQKWSPALGSLVADEARTPMPHTKLMEALMGVLPLLMQPHMIHRFHATRPLTGNMTGITTFQLDISYRTSGHQQVWECLEAMTGLTALQVIGLQLRRDTLKQSPAAALVQQALADCS